MDATVTTWSLTLRPAEDRVAAVWGIIPSSTSFFCTIQEEENISSFTWWTSIISTILFLHHFWSWTTIVSCFLSYYISWFSLFVHFSQSALVSKWKHFNHIKQWCALFILHLVEPVGECHSQGQTIVFVILIDTSLDLFSLFGK